jgi:hypothetical protein
MSTSETIAGEFKRLDGLRTTRIDASEQYAYYTIPSVFPREDLTDSTVSIGMLDSIGSAVVNHFANKLVTTLFSPNRPFFRLMPDSTAEEVKTLNAAKEGDDPEEQKQAQDAFDMLRSKFVTVEKDAVRYLERIGYRTAATNAAKLLIITGDVVIRSEANEKSAAYSMRDYVCSKDLTGRDVVLIVRDTLVYGALTPDQQASVQAAQEVPQQFTASTPVTIFTRLELTNDGRYAVTQAIDNHDIPNDAPRLVTEADSPFTHLSWNLSKGENYGRGLVEDFSGSFHMIDNFTNYQAKMAAKMADLKILVDPASGIDVQQLNTSDTGTYIAGKPGDVQNLSTGMDASLQYLEAIIQTHKRQISAAFLYQTGQTRDAERVTAEEIRENAAELEIAHGGVYSRFASDWQAKVASEAVSAIGEDMGDVVEPQIMTGMDSLSRTGEMQAVRIWMQDLAMTAAIPEDVRAWMKAGEFAQYAAIQRGVDHGAFVKTDEEFAAEQKQAQEALAAQQKQEADMQGQAQAQQAVASKL